MSFFLSTNELAASQAKVAKLNKRAAKAGIAAVAKLEVIETTSKTVRLDSGFDAVIVSHEVQIVGLEAVTLGEWTLAGTLDHDAAGNIFRIVPGFEVEIPAEFRGTDAERCDHCNVRRNRNQTVLVYNGTEFKQVGSDCVKLFLGVSASSLIAWAIEADELCERDGRSSRDDFTVSEFVAAASLVTAVYGFKPSSFDESTVGTVGELLAPKSAEGRLTFERRYPELAHPTEKDITRANELGAAALAWIAADQGTNDYIVNLRTAAAREFVGRNGGLLASLPNAFKKAEGFAAERAAKVALPASTHVAHVDAKITVEGAQVVYTNRGPAFSYYGPETLFVILQAADGNVFYINTTVDTKVGQKFEDASKDDVFTVNATVKAHKINNKDQAVTVLTRAKALEV